MIDKGLFGRAPVCVAAVIVGAVSSTAQADATVLHCKPAISHYCQNIHIGCSGRSKRKAASFEVHLDGAKAFVRRGDTQTDVAVAKRNGEIVLRYPATGNWIRILTNRTYAERLQAERPALMARGTCTPAR